MTSNIRFGYFGYFWKTGVTTPSDEIPSQATHSVLAQPKSSCELSPVQARPVLSGDTLDLQSALPNDNSSGETGSYLTSIWNSLFSPSGSPAQESQVESIDTRLRAIQSRAEQSKALGKAWLKAVQGINPKSGNPHAHYRRAHRQEFAELRQLLAKGVPVDYPDRYGKTALMTAAGKGYLPLVEFLLSHGANINATDNNGYNALHAAASGAYKVADQQENPHNRVAEYLISQGINRHAPGGRFGDTPIFTAARRGNIPLIRLLCTDPSMAKNPNAIGNTPLHEAVGNNQAEAAQLLIDLGAEVNAENPNNGNTPAHRAAQIGSRDMLILLYKKGADMQRTNQAGEIPRQMPNVMRNPSLANAAFLYM